MSPPLRQEFAEALAAVQGEMRQGLEQLAQVLETERAALDGGDIEALDRAGARKQALMQQLEQLDAERRLLARAVLTGTDSDSGLYDRSGELHAGARSRPLAAA